MKVVWKLKSSSEEQRGEGHVRVTETYDIDIWGTIKALFKGEK